MSAAQHFMRTVWAVARKDLTTELRNRESLSAMLVFSLLVVLIFNFALALNRTAREDVAAGVLWTAFIFAGTLGLNRSLAAEKDRGSLDGLLLAPIDRSVLYFGKALGNLLFMLAVEAIILPVFSVLYNINLLTPLMLVVVVLGTLGYAAVGTLLASMSVQTRARDILLPILLFPVAVPLLVAAVEASRAALLPTPAESFGTWLNLLIAYDIIYLAVAYMVFDYVVEE